MSKVRKLAFVMALLLAPSAARAQDPAPAAPVPGDQEEDKWSFSLGAINYLLSDERDYVQPTFKADGGRLHLEARHSYEDLDTASLWVGANFSFGEKTTVDLTPMLGGAFGRTDGIAPGFELTVAHGIFALYSEAEYLFASGDSSDSFFYAWTEMTWSPVEWFRAGLAGQRTRAYQSDLEIERGLAFGFTARDFDFSAYVLNPDQSHPTVMLGLTWSF